MGSTDLRSSTRHGGVQFFSDDKPSNKALYYVAPRNETVKRWRSFFHDVWHLEKPGIIISITGGATDFLSVPPGDEIFSSELKDRDADMSMPDFLDQLAFLEKSLRNFYRRAIVKVPPRTPPLHSAGVRPAEGLDYEWGP
jgi:hypothetical protein